MREFAIVVSVFLAFNYVLFLYIGTIRADDIVEGFITTFVSVSIILGMPLIYVILNLCGY